MPFARQGVVTMEARLDPAVLESRFRLEFAGRARLDALPLHRRIEAGLVDGDAALATDVRSQVVRKTVGVIEHERERAVERLRAGALGNDVRMRGRRRAAADGVDRR